jgi:hypothetical protein
MPDRFRGLTAPIFLIAISLAVATAITLLPIHHSDVGAEQLTVNDSSLTLSDTTATSQDSLYAEINRGFAALEPILVRAGHYTDRTRFPVSEAAGDKGMIDSDIPAPKSI